MDKSSLIRMELTGVLQKTNVTLPITIEKATTSVKVD
jgi:hypothetical protein